MKAAAPLALLWSAALGADSPNFLFLLGDDIGWGDLSYNGGTANTPRIAEWTQRAGTIVMQDGHSGGTVCSPTRASVLTGRNHFRDCVDYVYGCSDMTECVPAFPFAQQRTFTFADAVRASGRGYRSWFGGKWHLGSFYNDSEAYGGVTSSPLFHGFERMNATVEVAPTATANWQCDAAWNASGVEFGHYGAPNHCDGGPNPGGAALPDGCCFNYWTEDAGAPHGVTNLTAPSDADDAAYVASAFLDGFLGALAPEEPFAAQLSFHNCHIPFIGQPASRAACAAGDACAADDGRGTARADFSDAQLDFFACLNELDAAVGAVLDRLDALGRYEDTFVWFTTDNGPEVNCAPAGFCGDGHYAAAPGDAGPLRGRKRDLWEGGHRVPTVVSWPAVVGAQAPARASWELVVTTDFLATVMDALGVDRPAAQRDWAFDGRSVLPILRGGAWPDAREVGWAYNNWPYDTSNGYGYRSGSWKLVVGSTSCGWANCSVPMLFDLASDLGETRDLAAARPDVLAAMLTNVSAWADTVTRSRALESLCP